MKINRDLQMKINDLPNELADIAKILIKEVNTGDKSNSQIEEKIRREIREIVLEEEN